MAAPEGYTKLGNVGYADKGVYSADATYNKYNVVYHEGSTYVALKDNLHGVTPTNGENWRYMAKGFNEASADGITVIDTSGIIDGTKNKKTILQTFLDKVGDFIINKAVTNEALLLKLADYVKKTDIVQTESTATDKVPSSAYIKSVKDTINSNLEGYYKLSGGTAIPNGANLTGYKTPGNYYCPNNTVAASLTGSPTKKAFTLKVELSTGNSYPCQTIRDFATGKIYFRTFNIDTNAWSEWGYSIQNADMESKQITSTTDSNGLVSVGAKYPDYKKVVCTTTRTATIMHVYHNDSEWRAKAVDTSNNAIANATITINCIAFK